MTTSPPEFTDAELAEAARFGVLADYDDADDSIRALARALLSERAHADRLAGTTQSALDIASEWARECGCDLLNGNPPTEDRERLDVIRAALAEHEERRDG